jgi:hypothetical protein
MANPNDSGGRWAKWMHDPEIRRQVEEREARRADEAARLDAALEPVLQELAGIGVEIRSLSDFDHPHSKLETLSGFARETPAVSRDVTAILLKWLPVVPYKIQESIIRTMIYCRVPYDGKPLCDCFDNDREEHLRFPIALTITETQPTGITEWLIARAQQRRFGGDRGQLLLAVARHLPRETAISILRDALPDLPGWTAKALGTIGGQEEIAILEQHIDQPRAWERKEVERALNKIKRRLERIDQKRRRRQ